jgi:hypothetical protein
VLEFFLYEYNAEREEPGIMQITTNMVAPYNRILFSHSSEGQKPKPKIAADLVPSGGSV